MARILYTCMIYTLTPLILLRLLWRSRRAPAYRQRWNERFGFVGKVGGGGPLIWVHAVSVGETLAAIPLIRRLQNQYPEAVVLVTTTTPTGSAQVVEKLGASVQHCYCPYDMPGAIGRFLRRSQPSLLVIMETELWPNLIQACHHRGVPVVLANARLSAKSAAGYGKVSSLTRQMLRKLTKVAAQTEEDGARFVQLGLPESALEVTGNIKFDLHLDDDLKARAENLRAVWQGTDKRPIWLVASTHRGEDERVLAAFRLALAHHASLLLVLVPRHPERFNDVAALCEGTGLSMVRRSDFLSEAGGGLGRDTLSADTQLILGDSMGELLSFCGASDLVFVGGSLVPVGGHNLIEPAAWGVPVLTGPHVFNFQAVAQLLNDAGGLTICEDEQALAAGVVALLDDTERYQAMASAAHAVAEANRGALDRLKVLIDQQLTNVES